MHRKFETLLLFSPDVGSEDRQQVLDDLNRVVNEYSGQVVEVDDWGKRTLAYPVQKHTRGHYVRLVYGALGSVVAEMERRIRIADSVLKFMTVKLAEEFQPAEEA
jgi:small subunit ribosomal protein S6